MRRWLLIGLSLAGLAGGAIGVVSLVVTSRGVARDGELAAARRALAAGEHREAARHFDRYRAAAGAAADPDALVERATVLLQIAALADGTPKAVQRAVDAAFEAMRRRPDDLALRRRLADVQMANRDFKGAREHLLVIRESIGAGTSDDDPAAIDLAIARSWLGSGDHRQALDLVARLTGFDVAARSFAEAAPGADASTGAYLLLEEILRDHLDDPKAADAAVERCVQVHPDDPAALLPHARLALSRNDPQTSLRTAARAVALHPADPAAALAHARALSATGDAAAATAAYLEGLRRAPQDRPLFAAAARHVAMSGEPEQVLGMLDGVWERLGSQEEDALVFLATMRLDDSARTAFAERLTGARKRLGADNPAVIVLEGRVNAALGAWAAAEKPLVRARAIVPREAKRAIDQLLARCLAALGEPDAAIVVCQRLEEEPESWWGATSGLAEAQLDLGRTEVAGERVDALCDRWTRSMASDTATMRPDVVIPTLPTMIRVVAARPKRRRDWSVIETMIEALAATPHARDDGAIVTARAELLAARGDLDGAEAALPGSTEGDASAGFDALRIALLGRREGVDTMRAALGALPAPRRARADVLAAAAGVEAASASGDDRAWLRACAAASADVAAATEAVQLLQSLAAWARAAGWDDEARAVWERAAARLPEDFRPHLALAILAARRGDAEGAAAAAARVVAIEGALSPRGRVASAAALVAAARGEAFVPGERGGRSGPPADRNGPQARRLREARALLAEAGNERKNWQPVARLLADIESLEGNPMAAVGHLERALDAGPADPLLVLDLAATCDRCLRRADADRIRDGVAPAGVGGGDRLAIDARIRQGDLGAAAERALLAIDAEQADLPTLLWLGRLCSRAGLHERATALAAQATQTDPANPDGWLRLVECRLTESDAAAAAALATGCETVPPGEQRLLQARGDAVLGRTVDAERGFREAIEEADDDAAAAAALVDFLLERGRRKDAKSLLEREISGRWADRYVLRKWAAARLESLRDAPPRP